LLLAWLTLLPDIGPLPESSQTRDIVVFLRSRRQRTAKMAASKFDFWRLRSIAALVKRFTCDKTTCLARKVMVL
jgi:hypothetical protein